MRALLVAYYATFESTIYQSLLSEEMFYVSLLTITKKSFKKNSVICHTLKRCSIGFWRYETSLQGQVYILISYTGSIVSNNNSKCWGQKYSFSCYVFNIT